MLQKKDGVLDGGNLATLREQEARLEQIDKENFSLKLKIHFLEEALRKNGKDFNEAAVRENTELKVDKVTLQRDLKHYRKCLGQAEKDLEEYRRQLQEYVDKVKRRHALEGMEEEIESMRQMLSSKEAEIETLKAQLESDGANDAQIEKLQGDVEDLEAELRAKDRELDEKDDQLESLREELASKSSGQDDFLERDQEIKDLRDELEQSAAIHKMQLQDKDAEIEGINDQAIRLEAAEADIKRLKQELETNERMHLNELQKADRTIEERDTQIQSLEQRIAGSAGEADVEKLRNHIEDLQADLRDKERQADDAADKFVSNYLH